ncbi:MAG: hypothetical protein RL518_2369 [Pseudomonadota bacterium]
MSCLHNAHEPTLGLGTVQFGVPYGVSNSVGQTEPDEVREILKVAWRAGVRCLDTAHAYGTSETVLGTTLTADTPFNIVTKLPPLPPSLTTSSEILAWVRHTVAQSLIRLGRSSLYAVLVHHAPDAVGPHGSAILDGLRSCKESGEVTKIGVSTYEREHLEGALQTGALDLVQIPINILDQRLLEGDILSRLRGKGVEIHARSIFLQGLLLMSLPGLPAYFTPFLSHLEHFHNVCRNHGVSPMEMALAFIKTIPVDVAIVGVNTHEHLTEITTAYGTNCHSLSKLDFGQFAAHEEALVNPTLWRFPSR